MPTLLRAVTVLVLASLTAAAQSPTQNWNNVLALPVGTEVRIAAGSRTVRGEVQNLTSDTLTVNSGKNQETFTRQEVVRVLVQKGHHRGRNALIGMGIGSVAGLGIGLSSSTDCGTLSLPVCSKGTKTAGLAIGLGGLGALIGYFVPSSAWREVYAR